MIKMIVLDLDGTLLKNDKSISRKTQSILNLCRESSVKVIYATGRGGDVEKVAPSLLFDGRIVMGGAVAYLGDSIVYSSLIPFEVARPLLIACDKYGLKIASEISGMHYSNFIVSDEWSYITNFKVVGFSQHNVDAEKIYAIINNTDDVKFIESNLPNDLYMVVARDNLAMIMHKEATKAKAIAKLAEIWGINKNEIAAFGDDLNDIDMLNYAGIGVAMGNAVDEVKAIADEVCLSNEEDGIAEWILRKDLIKKLGD